MRTLALLAAVATLAGCATKPEPLAEPPKDKQGQTTAQGPGQGGGIGVTNPEVGAITPVTNSDSIGGAGGGGVQQAAKEHAMGAAARAGSGSLGQAGNEEGN